MSTDAPEPPWRTRRRPRPPREPLSQEAIVDAALRVLDEVGIDELSMRRVAAHLGTGPASLYWHVRNKDELLQLVYERLTGELPLPEPDPARWREQLLDLARAMRAQAAAHRDAGRLGLGRVPSGTAFARTLEWLLQLLSPLGVPDRVSGFAGDLASLYVSAFAYEESLGLASPTGEALPQEAIVDMFASYLGSLPADRFPNVRRVAGTIFSVSADERFEFGLDLLLRGLATYISPPPEGPSVRR